jgi:hypothetical protein
MTDAQLLEFGRAGRQLSVEANFGKYEEVFVIQLRRHALNGEETSEDDGRRRTPQSFPVRQLEESLGADNN